MKSKIELLEDSFKIELESILGNLNLSTEELYLVSTISSKFVQNLKSELVDSDKTFERQNTNFSMNTGTVKILYPDKKSLDLRKPNIPQNKLQENKYKKWFKSLFRFFVYGRV